MFSSVVFDAWKDQITLSMEYIATGNYCWICPIKGENLD